jgi:hypothetical protein
MLWKSGARTNPRIWLRDSPTSMYMLGWVVVLRTTLGSSLAHGMDFGGQTKMVVLDKQLWCRSKVAFQTLDVCSLRCEFGGSLSAEGLGVRR